MAESSNFKMLGARGAIESGLTHIQAQVFALEAAVEGNPALAFDLARAVVESTCRSILTDRKVPYSQLDDLPKLLKATARVLPFLPPNASGQDKVRNGLNQTINGLGTALGGVCALRNVCGFASHGADAPRPVLEAAQAMLAAAAADTIIGFLYRVHRQDVTRTELPPMTYESNLEFNEYVDDLHPPVRIFQEDFVPSRILFELATEPYRVYLADFNEQAGSDDDDASSPLAMERATAFDVTASRAGQLVPEDFQ